jgi:putative permease
MLFIIPLVVARVVNLHPVTVILVVILGAEVLGVLGMIISIPLAAAIKVTLVAVYQHLTDSTV